MNESPDIPPLQTDADAKRDRRMMILGFCTAFLGIPIAPIALLVAVILASIAKTRKFGLGMLLGVGAILLILLAICGGYILVSQIGRH